MQSSLAFLFMVLPAARSGQSGPTDNVGVYVEPNSYTLLERPAGSKLSFHFGYSASYDRGTPMVPFTHDEDDDGDDSLGYYNSRERRFYFANANPDLAIDREIVFGPPEGAQIVGELLPVVLDRNNDGELEAGVCDTGNNHFYLQAPVGGEPLSFTWAGDPSVPVVGDWNADGVDSLGLYHADAPSSFKLNNSVPPTGASETVNYGAPESLPCAGDWDGDGDDDVGYFDVEQRVFHRFGAADVPFGEELLTNFDNWPNEPAVLPSLWPLAGSWDESGGSEPSPYPWQTVPVEDLDLYGFDAGELEAAVAAGAALGHLNSLVVCRAGLIMKEAYYNGYTELVANHMMSATKSVLSALVGVANLDGAVSGNPAQPLLALRSHLLKEKFAGQPLYAVCGGNEIDLLDVMTMASGFVQNNNTWDDGVPPDIFPYNNYVEWVLNGPGTTLCSN
jgi:hypothetical protein